MQAQTHFIHTGFICPVQDLLYIYVTSLTVIFGGLFASPMCEKLLVHSHIP